MGLCKFALLYPVKMLALANVIDKPYFAKIGRLVKLNFLFTYVRTAFPVGSDRATFKKDKLEMKGSNYSRLPFEMANYRLPSCVQFYLAKCFPG